jgi:DNA replication protein DnaC
MSREIHIFIERLYDKKRQEAQTNLEDRRNEIYKKLPKIEDIDKKIALLGLKYNKEILVRKHSQELVSELSREIEILRTQKINYLKELYYPADYLTIKYSCENCKDTGFVQNEIGVTEKCSCYRQLLINITYSKSNIGNTDTQNFQNFDEKRYSDEINEVKYGIKLSPRQNILNIVNKSKQFIENIENEKQKGLFFVGPTGVGKTFLTYCLGRELMDKGRTVLYLTAPQLFNLIKEYRTASWDSPDIKDVNYNYIMDTELLIIDDLGIEPVTNSRYSELLTILTTRASNDNKGVCKTIISTNLNFKQIAEIYTERVASRLLGDYMVFRFVGNDLRHC